MICDLNFGIFSSDIKHVEIIMCARHEGTSKMSERSLLQLYIEWCLCCHLAEISPSLPLQFAARFCHLHSACTLVPSCILGVLPSPKQFLCVVHAYRIRP